MCYLIVFAHRVCNNDHPQPGSGEIFQRQCRQQAEDSERTGNWKVKCNRSTPPFFVVDLPDSYQIVTDNLDCETCCKIMADPELEKLRKAVDKISEERAKKKEQHAKFIEKLVKQVYLRDVKTDADRTKWHKDCDAWEIHQKHLEAEIKSVTNDLETAEKQWTDTKREIEEPDEDDFIDVAQEEYEEMGNQDRETGLLFYFGRPTGKEATDHPYHFPKCFPPDEMLRMWGSERYAIPYGGVDWVRAMGRGRRRR